MSLAQLFGRVVGKKIEGVRKSIPDPDALPRQDQNLPLGADFGDFAEISPMPFIRTDGTIVPTPTKGLKPIAAISRVKFQNGPKTPCYRYYLETGDNPDAKESFIQVYGTPDNIQSVRYYVSLVRFVPQSAEEQRMYTGVDGVGLGSYVYSFSPDQLLSVGIDESIIRMALAKPEGGEYESLGYYRAIEPDPSVEFVAPQKGVETRLDDAVGEKGIAQEVHVMVYERACGDASEFLEISLEHLTSHDGQADRDIHVDIMVGIEIGQDGVKFFGS